MNNGVEIGSYMVLKFRLDGPVWIQHTSGEGGHFDEKKLEEVIRTFFEANFQSPTKGESNEVRTIAARSRRSD